MKTDRFYYRTKWHSGGLYCPLGKVTTIPQVRVWAVDSRVIPFREVDKLTTSIPVATYEDAARLLCEKLHRQYGGCIKVRVGELGFWGETTIGGRKMKFLCWEIIYVGFKSKSERKIRREVWATWKSTENMIKAIKRHRELTGSTLKEAKEYCDKLAREEQCLF